MLVSMAYNCGRLELAILTRASRLLISVGPIIHGPQIVMHCSRGIRLTSSCVATGFSVLIAAIEGVLAAMLRLLI